MAIKFEFQINPEKINIHDPFTGYRLEIENKVVYRKKSGTVLALGDAEDIVKARLGWQDPTSPPSIQPTIPSSQATADPDIRYQALFSEDGEEFKHEILAMKYFTQALHRQSLRTRPFAHLAAKVFDNFDYLLFIQGYEGFKQDRRSALEQNLQVHLRIRKLIMNGHSVEIPLWKKNVEFWSRRFLTIILPVLMMLIGYLNMPVVVKSSAIVLLVYLLLITYGIYYSGKILWMLLARKLVPRDYRMCMLQGNRSQLSGWEIALVRALWGNK